MKRGIGFTILAVLVGIVLAPIMVPIKLAKRMM